MNKQDRFGKFTERARKVLKLAQEEAQRLQHSSIGTEHILLGLLREGQGVGAHVLSHMGADLPRLRIATEQILGKGAAHVRGEIGFTEEAEEALRAAMDEVQHLNLRYIGTEHILLGLAHNPESKASQILRSVGIKLDDLRVHTIQVTTQVGSRAGSSSGGAVATSVAAIRSRHTEQRTHFEKFTERARKALSLAQEEAQHLQHNYIGTEHLLLGLAREKEGVAGKVLAQLGVSLSDVRTSVGSIIGHGDRIMPGEIGLTPRAKKVIELAVEEARRLKHSYIGTEHILLGLLLEGDGIAVGVLENLNVNLESVRIETLKATASLTEEEAQPGADVISQQWKSRNNFDDYQFAAQVERVLYYAQEEARNLQHNYVGTEHLLLGLLREDGGVAAQILKSLGADLTRTRAGIETLVGRGERTTPDEVPLTPLARAQIHLAADEANRLGHTSISTEHLLLGLVREGEGIASSVLGSLGVSLEMARTKILEFLQERDQQ